MKLELWLLGCLILKAMHSGRDSTGNVAALVNTICSGMNRDNVQLKGVSSRLCSVTVPVK